MTTAIPPATLNGQHAIPPEAMTNWEMAVCIFKNLPGILHVMLTDPYGLRLLITLLSIVFIYSALIGASIKVLHQHLQKSYNSRTTQGYSLNISQEKMYVTLRKSDWCEGRIEDWFKKMGNDCLLELQEFPHHDLYIEYKDLRLMVYRCASIKKTRALAFGPIKIHYLKCYDNAFDIGIREKS